MKKRLISMITLLLLLSACQLKNNITSHVIIDWVPFVKINNQMYEHVYGGVIADEKYIGEQVGEVTFKLDENIIDPYYKPKNGDAAYLDKGTRLYQVKDMPNLIAAKNDYVINGYELFLLENEVLSTEFESIKKEAIEKIEVWNNDPPHHDKTLVGDEIDKLLLLLDGGEKNNEFIPSYSEESLYLSLVFDMNEPIHYIFDIQFDGETWYWHPNDLEILSNMDDVFRSN